jgi:hypothetical protein
MNTNPIKPGNSPLAVLVWMLGTTMPCTIVIVLSAIICTQA